MVFPKFIGCLLQLRILKVSILDHYLMSLIVKAAYDAFLIPCVQQ